MQLAASFFIVGTCDGQAHSQNMVLNKRLCAEKSTLRIAANPAFTGIARLPERAFPDCLKMCETRT